MKTTLYLIRHGQTEWNVERRMQGQSDSPLTEKGIRMTCRLAATLPAVDAVYASPLGRTLQTARLLFGEHSIHTDNQLREINLGEWEGRLQAELDREEPEQHKYFWHAPDQFQVASSTYSGETFFDISKRAEAFLKHVLAAHDGERVAVVSHTTIIRAMLFSIETRPLSDFWNPPAVYPASISEIEAQDGVLKIKRLGCINHYEADEQPAGAY